MRWMWTAGLAIVACAAGLMSCSKAEAPASNVKPMPLKNVRTWMYQLSNVEDRKAAKKLAHSGYDLLVVEPTMLLKDSAKFDARAMVAKLHAGKPGRLVMAYIDIGQAETYRTYWQKDWTAPTKGGRGSPDFLLAADPDGWSDSYTVAYWDPRWRQIMIGGPESCLGRVMAAGFDGVYLDWVAAYEEEKAVAAAKAQKIDPAKAMVDLLLALRQEARRINPDAIVIGQNAPYLLDEDPRYTDAVDGVAFEDTWFAGKANAKWDSPEAGGIANRFGGESSTAELLKQYGHYLAKQKTVLTVDYCVDAAQAEKVYAAAKEKGLVPLVTRVSLDHLTATPPGELKQP